MNAYFTQLRAFFGRLSTRQRLTLGAVVVGGVALLGGVAYWAGRPDYALLFGGLDAADAARVVEQLQSDGTTYELREGGTAVFVPRTDVYELRLRFAAEGLVSDGQTGYELFDGGTLGMTDFMQKVSYKRALEGELARTITSVRGIDGARVHLVLPERNPFRDRQVKPSASVVVHLGGGRPGREQVAAITALVGGAVESLSPSDVTVVDAQGNLLSDPAQSEADGALSSSQLRYQRAVEEHLTEQGQSMLNRVLGAERALVRVSANLDFSRTVTETERIDPESATIISEERMDEQGAAGGAASTVRNYEMTREREQREQGAGEVRYLTVSVILDHRPAAVAAAVEGEEAAPAEPVPYTAQELSEIEQLVKNAVGFSDERGDRITVQQARFDTSEEATFAAEFAAQRRDERMQLYLRYGLMALALLVGAWLLRTATARVSQLAGASAEPKTPQPDDSDGEADGEAKPKNPFLTLAQRRTLDSEQLDAVAEDFYTSRLSPDARTRLNAKRQFYEATQAMVAEQPEEASALIGTWLAEDRTRLN